MNPSFAWRRVDDEGTKLIHVELKEQWQFYPEMFSVPILEEIHDDNYPIQTLFPRSLNHDPWDYARGLFDKKKAQMLEDWKTHCGGSNELSDIVIHDIPRQVYMVGCTTFPMQDEDTSLLYLPEVKGNRVEYTTDGRHSQSAYFEKLADAKTFYNRAMRELFFSYQRKMDGQKLSLVCVGDECTIRLEGNRQGDDYAVRLDVDGEHRTEHILPADLAETVCGIHESTGHVYKLFQQIVPNIDKVTTLPSWN